MIKSHYKRKFLIISPVFGLVIFVLLYIIAACRYPGGSAFNNKEVGFSWLHNYWCNLLNEVAINGEINQAQPIAMLALIILCISLSVFWILFPGYTQLHQLHKKCIQVSGVVAMTISILLFTKLNHDLITNTAALFGIVAVTGTLWGVFQNRWNYLFYFGCVNLILIMLNGILYYQLDLIFMLPVVQKITFACFLVWIAAIQLKIVRSLTRK